jgi:phosphatidylinositol glycan class B
MFAIPALQVGHRPRFIGADDVWTAFKQYFRMSHFAFQLILVASLLPYLYLNAFHGGAQVSVTNALRTGAYGPVDSLTVLMPCHSTPWASHLGDIADRSWFLTCEPPLTPDAAYRTQQEAFYDAPVTYLRVIFPFPPDATSGLHASLPSHILLFGCLLDEAEDGVTFGQVLAESGYTEVANLWNGFDVAQDEEKRAGGVRVWRRKDTIT